MDERKGKWMLSYLVFSTSQVVGCSLELTSTEEKTATTEAQEGWKRIIEDSSIKGLGVCNPSVIYVLDVDFI